MKVESGYSFYGQKIGVLVFVGKAPRIPGDPGNAQTFSYPVRYKVIRGSFRDLVRESEGVKEAVIQSCRELKTEGVTAVIADCGLMSIYQDIIGKESGVLFAGASLLQVPLIWQFLGASGSIGIITGHSGLLSEKHLRRSGITPDIRIAIQGMQDEPEFSRVVLNGATDLVPERMEKDVLAAGEKLKSKEPDLRAVVLECSNLGSFSRALAEHLDLPVFDMISLANLLAYGVIPPKYY